MKKVIERLQTFVSIKQTLIYFGLMAVLYVFSLFGSMFSGTGFTYADF